MAFSFVLNYVIVLVPRVLLLAAYLHTRKNGSYEGGLTGSHG
jgi:hypothetical protein